MRSLNRLKWLHAFEATARHGSFTGAAQELGVTPAAVGQLVRDEDVQILHGFNTRAQAQAQAYLSSLLFTQDVVAGLKPYLNAAPEVRIYGVI